VQAIPTAEGIMYKNTKKYFLKKWSKSTTDRFCQARRNVSGVQSV
jgi:hypothetical protein